MKMNVFVACGVLFTAMPIIAETETIGGYTWTYRVENGSAVLSTGSEVAAVSPSPTNSITIPSVLGGKPVRKIGAYAFMCSAPSVTLPEGVTCIEGRAFYGCTMTRISIPNTVTSIGEGAFVYCRNLQTVTIPASVENIDSNPFDGGCDSLTSIEVASGNSFYKSVNGVLLTKDGRELISGRQGDVVIPEGVEYIRPRAFFDTKNLTSVVIPNSVTSIGSGAFWYCRSLRHITIPTNLTDFPSQNVFPGCSGLEYFSVEEGNPSYKAVSGMLLTKDGLKLVSAVSGDVEIPNGVTTIGSHAFSYLNVNSVTIPNSLRSIGSEAFMFCSGLTRISIPESVTSIIGYAFYACPDLTSVIIGENVTSIGSSAFAYCGAAERFVFKCAPPTANSSSFMDVKPGAVGIYPAQHKTEWEAILDEGGYWKGLRMMLGASIEVLPTAMDWVKKELTIGWTWSANEDNEATPPVSYNIYYSDNTNTYDTANVVAEGLSGLLRSYKDNEYLNRLDGLKPVCYFVVGSDGSVGVCQTRNRHGIFVGLNEWENPNLESIGGDKNANDLYNLALLQGEFQDSNISLLLNSNATIINVNVAFEKVKAEALPGDVCLFYFSTHGGIDTGKTACLCMYNGYYTDQMLAKKIADIDSGVAIVGIVSACHSGGLYDTDPSWDEWYVKNNLAQCTPNIAWLSSSGVANTAYGVFDEFLLKYGWEKGWAGPDEMISFNDLATYTKEQYDTLFSGTILKGEKKSKTAQIEDPGELLASIVAGRRGDHETGIRKPSVPNNVDVKTGLYLDQLDVTLKPVADADEYCIFLLGEDGCYEKIWTPSAERLQTVDLEHSSVLLSNKRFSDTSLQVLVKAVNGAGVSQAVTSERKELVRITFDGNGGEVGNWRGAEAFEVSTGYFVVFGDVSVGSELLTLPSAGTYSVVGYEFKGWFDENGTEATPETEVSQSTVYYARWESSATEPEFNVDENGVLVGIDYGGATEITLPDTVTSIGNSAFEGCTGLASVTIPKSVTSIGYSAFSGCPDLQQIVIPRGVTSIANFAFGNCISLSEVMFEGDMNSIDMDIDVAFAGTPWLESQGRPVSTDGFTIFEGILLDVDPQGRTEIIIPNTVVKIGRSAFSWTKCANVKSVVIPNSVLIIDREAFAGCNALERIFIPDSVVSIEERAFQGSGLREAVIGKGVLNILTRAFAHCEFLERVIFRGRVEYIGDYAFYGCVKLDGLDLPDSLSHIGSQAFGSCSSISSIRIPAGLTDFQYAFGGCTNISHVSFPLRIGNLASYGLNYLETAEITDFDLSGTGMDPKVWSTTFFSCPRLRRVDLPEGVETIGSRAFEGCTALEEVTIPNSVTNVADLAFYGCENLYSVEIPEGVVSIGDYAFSKAEIEYLTIPESVVSMGSSEYKLCLSDCRVKHLTAPLHVFEFAGIQRLFNGRQDVIETLTITGGFDGLDTMPDGLLQGCASLREFHIPDVIRNIGEKAFERTGLETVVLPKALDTIGDNAFSYCTNLIEIAIPPGVSSIGNSAFYGCRTLKSIIIPTSVVSIGDGAFDNCKGLVTAYVPLPLKGLVEERKAAYKSLFDYDTHIIYYDGILTDRIYTVTFDAGGGTIDEVSRVYTNEVTLGALPMPSRGKDIFKGWWDRSQRRADYPGSLGDPFANSVDENTHVFSDVTYYAHWLKVYSLAFDPNGGDLDESLRTIEVNGGDFVGAPVPVRNKYTFLGWYTELDGGEKLPFWAIQGQIRSGIYYAHWQYDGRSSIAVQVDEGCEAMGKTTGGNSLYKEGENVPLKATANRGYVFAGWYASGTLLSKAASYTYSTTDKDTTIVAHFATADEDVASLKLSELMPRVFTIDGESNLVIEVESISAAEAKLKGLPAGMKFDPKTLTISGAPMKPGVYTVAVSMTNAAVKKPVSAEFEIVVPNLASEKLPGLEQDTDAYGVVMCGVNLDAGLIDCTPEDGWTVKVAGLPAGLKFTAKDIMKKGSKTEVEIPANTIYGVPTKAGTYTVTFTATKKGEANQIATITLKTEALPVWATGTFTGYVAGTWDACHYHGSATMTVAANGKVSGKIALEGTNWTFSAMAFSRVEHVERVEGGVATNFVVEAVAKAGKVTRDLTLTVGGHAGRVTLPNAVAEGTFGDGEVKMWRGMWKDKSTAAEAKATIEKFMGVYNVSVADDTDYGSGYLSLTVGKDGNVKASGKLADGTSVSVTSPLMCDDDAGWFVMMYAAPSAYKGGAFAAAVGFENRLAPVLFIPQWTSRNPQATEEYGEGFVRDVDLVGAYYDKLEKLRKYYESVRLNLDDAPELGFTYKETSLNAQGKKVTTSSSATTSAVDTLSQSGLTATVNEKGAIVVEKATKPLQDKATKEWSYDGANDGALTLSFTQATGIFKGSYTFWYDYVSAYDETKAKDNETRAHTSKKVNFEGILVQGEEPKMDGFYLWDVTGEYEDEKTGKTKTYKYKQSYPVRLFAE